MIRLAREKSPVLFWSGLIHIPILLVVFALYFLRPIEILGINGWIKPMKFAMTGAIYLLTMAIYGVYMPPDVSKKRLMIYGLIMSFALFGETILIAVQSFRGVRSHFNHDTPLNDAIYGIMGIMILVNTFVAFVFFRKIHAHAGCSPLLALALKWGGYAFIFGSVIGGLMSGLDRHSVGVSDGGEGIPFFNWSTKGGDIRIAHFLGLHSLQVIPLIAIFLEKRIDLQNQSKWIHAIGIAYNCVVVLVLAIALSGRSVFGVFTS